VLRLKRPKKEEMRIMTQTTISILLMEFSSKPSLVKSGGFEGMDGCLDLAANGVDGFTKVVGELHTQPVAGIQAKVSAQVEVGFRRDAAFFIYDLVDALLREMGVLGQAIGGNSQRGQKLFTEEFAGVDVKVFAHGFLVIVGYFYVVGALPVPSEAYSVLIVYPDAVLPGSIAL
jgi:hypothetical protein